MPLCYYFIEYFIFPEFQKASGFQWKLFGQFGQDHAKDMLRLNQFNFKVDIMATINFYIFPGVNTKK